MTSVVLRVDSNAPRYFRHRALGIHRQTAFELAGASLVAVDDENDDYEDASTGGGANRVVSVRVRCDGGPAHEIARLIPGVCESAKLRLVFAGADARFSARGGSVELLGRLAAAGRDEDGIDDDDEREAMSTSSSSGIEGYGSDESWGTDEESSREIETVRDDGEDAREDAARREAAATGAWRSLEDVRATMTRWDARTSDDDGGGLKFHVQSPGARRSSRMGTMPTFAWTGSLRPFPTTAKRTYPSGLTPPDYATSGWPDEEFGSRYQSTIEVKTQRAREGMRAACSLARHVMDVVAWAIEPGVTTEELDRICHAVTVGNGAYPSPLNYMGFPKSLCTSVNEVVCHGIPDSRPLREGDVVNLDITIRLSGYHGDLNETYYVGKGGAASKTAQKLMDCTRRALDRAIAHCRPGRRFRDLGEIIADEAARGGYASVKDFCGHGIGELFHCAPNVPHYAKNKAVGVMKEGMTFTIEPMFNESSSHKVVHWPDGWTAVTTNGARSAQYEHTLLITSDGVEVLTARTENSRPFIL